MFYMHVHIFQRILYLCCGILLSTLSFIVIALLFGARIQQ